MGGARVTTLVTLRKCTLGHKREIKTLKFVSASTKGFKGGLSLDQALQERHGSDFFLLHHLNPQDSTSQVQRTGLSAIPLNSPNWEEILRTSSPSIRNCQVWAHHAVIPNGDREIIGEEADIDVIIEQVQTIPATSFPPANNNQRSIDLRFAHSIRAIFFALRNSTYRSEWSNYGTNATMGRCMGTPSYSVIFGDEQVDNVDPIARAVLTYENVERINIHSDYYSLVAPYYTAEAIPESPGLHVLPYCNRLAATQPNGSTNFARLASVTLAVEASERAVKVDTTRDQARNSSAATRNTFEVDITAISLSILRMSAGTVGFPVV